MRKTSTITAKEIKDNFQYDPNSGQVFRLYPSGRCRTVGYVGDYGYIRVNYNDTQVAAHRIAWVLHNGSLPSGVIDHINGIKSDNRICNLRDVTDQVNGENRRHAYSSSKTQVLGVSWHKAMGKFRARVRSQYKVVHESYHDTIEEAQAAYLKAKRLLHFGCTI